MKILSTKYIVLMLHYEKYREIIIMAYKQTNLMK